MLIYSVFMMVGLLAVASLAVDWGYIQCTKAEMQRTADAAARGYISYYDTYGVNTANTNGPQLYQSSWNPVDASGGFSPTVTTTWGYWNNGFVAGTNSSYPVAMKVVMSRKATNSNALRLPIARSIGFASTDLTCTAIAVRTQAAASITASVPATSDIWLSGMPNGSTASYNDTTSNAAAYRASTIPVTPGTYMTFAYISGYASNGPNIAASDADGDPNWVVTHEPGAENGIGNLTAPIHSLIGVFLDNNAPNTTATPPARDYSTAASREQSVYSDIQLKQAFFIGDGLDANGNTQRFLVPTGATRFYLGSMDGYEWNNNWGTYSITVAVDLKIELKQ
ncbi:MAG TPA: pilus assembly protein TadG-related protein [Humisphaera sp.]